MIILIPQRDPLFVNGRVNISAYYHLIFKHFFNSRARAAILVISDHAIQDVNKMLKVKAGLHLGCVVFNFRMLTWTVQRKGIYYHCLLYKWTA